MSEVLLYLSRPFFRLISVWLTLPQIERYEEED